MNKYNPRIHHRRSIRLKGYDYAKAGLYFITICCQGRICRFGRVENGEMKLNDAGAMIEKWYYELENKFPDIKCNEMIVMPNHFHCIIQNVGADLRVCPNLANITAGNQGVVVPGNPGVVVPGNPGAVVPDNTNQITAGNSNHDIMDDTTSIHMNNTNDNNSGEHVDLGEHLGSPQHLGLFQQIGSPLGSVVQWFKTMSTNEYIRGVKTLGWKPFNGKLWQRNYYEHIIRNEKSQRTISNYIINNPMNWDKDKFHG